MPRPMTEEECREALFDQIATMFRYWRTVNVTTDDEVHARMEGLLLSLFVILDGGSMALPGFNLSPAPHPDDEEYCRSQDEDWWPDGLVINEAQLHEIFPWDKLKKS